MIKENNMGESEDHSYDILKAVINTTSNENIVFLQEVIDLVIDGQDTKKTKDMMDKILTQLGIPIDKLYQKLIDKLDPVRVEKDIKLAVLIKWLFPVKGPRHQLSTHRGMNYNYSSDDSDDWGGLEKEIAWQFRKKILIKAIKKVYPSFNDNKIEQIAAILYNIHRLRDLQYNGGKEIPPGVYLKNIPEELRLYMLPLISNKSEKSEFIKDVNELENLINDYFDNYFTNEYNLSLSNPMSDKVDELIGELKGENNGKLNKILFSILNMDPEFKL